MKAIGRANEIFSAPKSGNIVYASGLAQKFPGLAARLDARVLVPIFNTPEEFAARLKAEQEKWAAHIRHLGIKADE